VGLWVCWQASFWGNNMALDKNEKNRRIKLGILALTLTVLAYAIAKITNDTSGDWFRFALLCVGLAGLIGGELTFTDVLGKK